MRHCTRSQFHGKFTAAAVAITLGSLIVMLGARPALADPTPTLWGIGEDNGQLFSIGDYTDAAATFTDYGKLKYYDHRGRLRRVGSQIEAFTVAADGTAYMSMNKTFNGLHKPVLLSLDLNGATTSGDNIVSIIGQVDRTVVPRGDELTGLSIDPLSGTLYGLLRTRGSNREDHLVSINQATGSVLSVIGPITGLGQKVSDGQDMAFDVLGRLYVTDDKDDHLYRVNVATGAITDLLDSDEGGSVKFEALAFDFANDVLLGSETRRRGLREMTFMDGNNSLLADIGALGVRDLEGMAFQQNVPEPATAFGLGLFGLFIRRRQPVK
ncbi:MAG: PEP-CTERM sorting domain-containing protein [Anaerolineaceae bacterium]|nr:PEP-CTERM sorting domain-containing protein [Anaerolineaceae bacterium]